MTGLFLVKLFYKVKKQEQIALVNVLKKEIYDYQVKSNEKNQKASEVDLVAASYSLSALSIA